MKHVLQGKLGMKYVEQSVKNCNDIPSDKLNKVKRLIFYIN